MALTSQECRKQTLCTNINSAIRFAALLFVVLFFVGAALACTSCTSPKNDASVDSSVETNVSDDSEQSGASAQPAERLEGVPAQRIDPDELHSTDKSPDSSFQKASSQSSSASEQASADDNSSEKTSLIVRFIDVGQGDCALISCDNMHLLIDGGPPEASSKIYAILKRLNISHLDYVIATHPDADHIGGISGALNYASCGVCYCSTATNDTQTFISMNRFLSQQNIPIRIPTPGDSFSLGNATVTFIGPTQELEEINNNSLVCRIDHGSNSFLFTGDAEVEEEMLMIESGANLEADVLKVAHHGSAYSSTMSFLQEVNPGYAVISVGSSNTYGHPTSVVLEELSQLGATVIRTDEVGNILFHSDGTVLDYMTTKGKINE